MIVEKQTEENEQLETNLRKLKDLYNEYSHYDQYSSQMLENMKTLNHTQLAMSKQQSIESTSSHSAADGENLDPDQFESLSTLMFHKLFQLPLVDMKTKQLSKPVKKNEWMLWSVFFP